MPVLTRQKLEEIKRQDSSNIKIETLAIANDINQESLNDLEVYALTQDIDIKKFSWLQSIE